MVVHSIVYCYTPKFSQGKNINHYLKLFKKSVEQSKKFHPNVSISTDIEGYKLLKNFPCEVRIQCPNNLKYLDDYKLFCLEYYPDSVIIDPDIVFFKQLMADDNYSIYADFNAIDVYQDFKTKLSKRIELWKDKGFENLYPEYFDIDIIPNLGLLQIPDEEFKNYYINIYNKIKNWCLENVDYNLIDSRLIGEFSLGYCKKKKNAHIQFYREKDNLYDHYAGDSKYDLLFKVKHDTTLL